MIMRVRYIGTELIDHIPFGKVYYVRFKQHKDLTVSIHAANGEGLSYTDLYHFLTEWKILNIEKGRENERFNKPSRSSGFSGSIDRIIDDGIANFYAHHLLRRAQADNHLIKFHKGL